MPNKRPSVKNERQYEALKDKGMSKERAAKIANSPDASKHGGEKFRLRRPRFPRWNDGAEEGCGAEGRQGDRPQAQVVGGRGWKRRRRAIPRQRDVPGARSRAPDPLREPATIALRLRGLPETRPAITCSRTRGAFATDENARDEGRVVRQSERAEPFLRDHGVLELAEPVLDVGEPLREPASGLPEHVAAQ